MFDLDKWQEIFSTIQKNKLRTFLTGFSVAWGIFMLVILLGTSKGIQNGVANEFNDDAVNSIWLYSNRTTMPYKGLKEGRMWEFNTDDYDYIDDQIEGTEFTTNRYNVWGRSFVYKAQSGNYPIRSSTPEHQELEKTKIIEGRFLNDADLEQRRKVVVLGKLIVEDLFEEENPLGKYVKIQGFPFKVVGFFEDDGSEREMRIAYIPTSTGQMIFTGGRRISQIMATVGNASLRESWIIASKMNSYLAQKHSFDPRDRRALYISNNVAEFEKYQSLFSNMSLFIWFIGFGTIFAGIVGISNIMLIVVKERTREIGIRKAMGASPNSIISLVLTEAVFITATAGYIGLVLGVGVLEMLGNAIKGVEMFQNPEIDFRVAISATVLLIISGIIAGYIPARRAASIEPVEALREE